MLSFGENKQIDFRESVGFAFLSFLPFFLSLIYQFLVYCFLSLFIKVTSLWSIDAQHFFDLKSSYFVVNKKDEKQKYEGFSQGWTRMIIISLSVKLKQVKVWTAEN